MFEKTRTLLAVYRARDPRGLTAADTLFRSPGFHAVLAHRAAHFCALQGWRGLADGIAAFSAQMTGVRIHADARVGENVYLAPGVWLGPDAVVPDGAEVFPEGPALPAVPGAESDEERLRRVEGAPSDPRAGRENRGARRALPQARITPIRTPAGDRQVRTPQGGTPPFFAFARRKVPGRSRLGGDGRQGRGPHGRSRPRRSVEGLIPRGNTANKAKIPCAPPYRQGPRGPKRGFPPEKTRRPDGSSPLSPNSRPIFVGIPILRQNKRFRIGTLLKSTAGSRTARAEGCKSGKKTS